MNVDTNSYKLRMEPFIEALNAARDAVAKAEAEVRQTEAHNENVEKVFDNLRALKLPEEAIEAAMEATFGHPKRRRARSPRLEVASEAGAVPSAPTVRMILQKLDNEGAGKRVLFEASGLTTGNEEHEHAWRQVVESGWVVNGGGRGAGALWRLTDAGREARERI